MKVQVQTEAGFSIVSALLYAFPKKGNAPADYTLMDGEGAPLQVAQTGGGKYPKYVYFMWNGVSHYLPKNVIPVSGTWISAVKEEATPTPTTPTTDTPALVVGIAEAKAAPAKKQRKPK